MILINVLYSDSDLAVVQKPAGMLVHPSPMERRPGPTLVEVLREQLGGPIHLINRLDRAASGCLLITRSPEATARLAELLKLGEVRKTYWIVVRGWTPENGQIDRPLVPEKGGEAKAALTRYRRLACTEIPEPVGKYPSARYSWVEVKIDTGRYHQIRRHFAGISHPVVGDSVYGDGRHNDYSRSWFGGQKRLFLFARSIEFLHFRSGQRLRSHAELDSELAPVFSRLFGGEEASAHDSMEPHD